MYHLRVKRKVVRGYKNLTNAERYPVELHKKNLSRVPKEISDNAFYLRAFAKPRGEVWYHNKFNGKRNVRRGTKENHDKARILRGISQTILLGEVPPRGCTQAV